MKDRVARVYLGAMAVFLAGLIRTPMSLLFSVALYLSGCDFSLYHLLKMRNRLYLGATSCTLAGVILAVTAAGCSGSLVMGLTIGAGACFVATGAILTIRRRWHFPK